uniref:Uncharacterized protein n=1 Tax=Arundo donax TaxID=35708 RepID=A0A0A9HGA5_ARUDO
MSIWLASGRNYLISSSSSISNCLF